MGAIIITSRYPAEWIETSSKSYGGSGTRTPPFAVHGERLAGAVTTSSRAALCSCRNASKNLIDPEPKTRDGRISGKRAEELARDTTNNAEYERLYPGYFLADAGAWHNDVNGGKYIVARFYRRDGVFIKPKRRKRK